MGKGGKDIYGNPVITAEHTAKLVGIDYSSPTLMLGEGGRGRGKGKGGCFSDLMQCAHLIESFAYRSRSRGEGGIRGV